MASHRVFLAGDFNDFVGEFFNELYLLGQSRRSFFQLGHIGNGSEVVFARRIRGLDGQAELGAGFVVVQVTVCIEHFVATPAAHQTVVRLKLRIGHFETRTTFGASRDLGHRFTPDRQHHPSSNTAGARSNHCA